MKQLTRRSVTTGLAAAVAAIPAVAFANAAPGYDPLPEAIGRYRAVIAACNASRGKTDEELDAWIDRADAILVEAAGLPVVTMAGAAAVLSLFVDEHWELAQHSIYGDQWSALAKAAANYIVTTAT